MRRFAGLLRTDPVVHFHTYIRTCFRVVGALFLTTSSLPADETRFSIAAVADVQYADTDPRGTREPREAIDRLKHAIAQWNQRNLDWGVILGDLIDWDDIDYGKFPGQTVTVEPRQWKHTRAILTTWRTLGIPGYLVLGNHDYYVPETDADGTPKPASVYRAFGFMDRAYYEFEHKGFRFIVMEGDVSQYNYDSRTEEYREAKAYYDALPGPKQPWNAGISSNQLLWLTGVLDKALAAREPVVIMCHYPIHRAYGHVLLNGREVLDVLDSYPNVVLWLNGHNHQGDYAKLGTRHHLTLKGMQNEAENWYQVDFSPGRITVYQAEELTTPVHDLETAWPP